MQILKLFSIRDSASETFTYPMCFITHGVAEREFKEIVNDKNSKISKNPEHYDLYELGSNSSGLNYNSLVNKLFLTRKSLLVRSMT